MSEHDLFPPTDEDTELPEINFIYVKRFEKNGPVWCPDRFAPSELTSLMDLSDRFGGGSYELIAYGKKGIAAKRTYTIAGPSKPLVEGSDVPSSGPSAAPSSPKNGGGGLNWQVILTLASTLGPSLLQMLTQSRQEQMQFMMAMMKGSKEDSDRLVQLMQAQSTANVQTMTTFFAKMSEMQHHAGGGGNEPKGVMDILLQGMEMGADIAKRGGGGDGETLGQIGQTIAALSQMELEKKKVDAQLAQQNQPSPPSQNPVSGSST